MSPSSPRQSPPPTAVLSGTAIDTDPGVLLAEAGWVRNLARRLARDQAAADDVAQDTLKLALERFPHSQRPPRPWLARVAARLARRQRRSEVRRSAREARALAVHPPENEAPAVDVLLERLELQQDLAAQVRALPQPYRGVILRRYYEGLSTAEIARAAGTTPATVRSQLARGLEQLRRQFKSDRSQGSDSSAGNYAAFVLAAGTGGSIVPRVSAQLLAMNSSIKIASVTLVAAAIIGMVSYKAFGPDDLHPKAAGPSRAGDALQPASKIESADRELAPTDGAAGRSASTIAAASPPSVELAGDVAEVELALSRVRARLIDGSGAPLFGAALRSVYSDGRPRGTSASAASDEQGRVEVCIPDGDMRAWRTKVFPMVFAASAKGCATTFTISTAEWRGTTDLGPITLEPGGTLTGLVVDTQGQPLEAAIIYAGDALTTGDPKTLRLAGPDRGIPRPRADSVQSGRFTLSGVRFGETQLWAYLKGHLWTISSPYTVSGTTPVDVGAIVLEPVPKAQRITGRVLLPNGSPAAQAQVAYAEAGTGRESFIEAETDGRFLYVPAGTGAVRFVARDGAGEWGMSAMITAHRGDEGVRLELRERRVIEVRVTDTDGSPLKKASMMAFFSEGPSIMAGGGRPIVGEDWALTSTDGRAEVPVPHERFFVSVSLRGYKAQRVGPWQPASAPLELTVALESEPSIQGRVLAYGQPVAGAEIATAQRIPGFVPLESGFPIRYFTSSNHGIVSDTEGHFTCPVDADWTDITVIARRTELASGETQLKLEAGAGARDVVIEVTAGGSLTGQVLPPPGQSPEGLFVAASCGDGSPLWTRADSSGRYQFTALMPGPWRVEGREREPARETLAVAQTPEEKDFRWNVDIVDGKQAHFDVDMRHQGQVELHGRFTIDGSPPHGWVAELTANAYDVGRTALPVQKIGTDGDFVLTAPAGRYDLKLTGRLEDGASAEILRELDLVGPRMDWTDDVLTGPIDEHLSPTPETLRSLRGSQRRGKREIVYLEPGTKGHILGRLPLGTNQLQSPVQHENFMGMWQTLRKVDVVAEPDPGR